MQVDVPTLAGRIGNRAAQYLTALTDGRVDGFDVTHDGQGLARVGGKQVPVGQVEARDVDWVWLALRLTLLERLVSADPMPILLEDMPPSFGITRSVMTASAPFFWNSARPISPSSAMVTS